MTNKYVQKFAELTAEDTGKVGGKNSSLGEMIRNLKTEGVRVPDGFATTTAAYRQFLSTNDITKFTRWHCSTPTRLTTRVLARKLMYLLENMKISANILSPGWPGGSPLLPPPGIRGMSSSG